MGLKKLVNNPYSPKMNKMVRTVDLRIDFRPILGIRVCDRGRVSKEEGGDRILGFLGLVRSFKVMAHERTEQRNPHKYQASEGQWVRRGAR